MVSISNIIFYGLIFFALYVQVFFFITFLEHRKKIVVRKGKTELESYPSVTIIVSCWNEEKTIYRTIRSLLDIDYPKDKFDIFLIDDGSTDNTWNLIKRFEKYPNVSVFRKENGGKHTAINFGLQHVKSKFVACLDADSFVHPQALSRMMQCFVDNKDTMAVIPATIIHEPKNFTQKIQKMEYFGSIFIKKMLGLVNGIPVTPGTLPIYKREVFDRIGGFRKAHNTEHGEIALRMHQHNMKIEYCHDAYVYTVPPDTFYKLYKQRLRWSYGFIKNIIDYRHILFRPRFGAVSLLSLPSGIVSILSVVFLFFILLFNFYSFLVEKLIKVQAIGISEVLHFPRLDWFFFDINSVPLVLIVCYALIIFSILVGRKITENQFQPSFYIFFYMITYSVIAPIWFLKAVYNVIVSERPKWR